MKIFNSTRIPESRLLGIEPPDTSTLNQLPIEKVDYKTEYTKNSTGLLLKESGAILPESRLRCLHRLSKDGWDTELLEQFMSRFTDARHIAISGGFFYPEDGYMGWHTNHRPPTHGSDFRVYITHNQFEGNTFKYVTDKVNTIEEPLGWSIKVFDVTKPLWHCVTALRGGRYSLGLRLVL
jgi:hypothetical protein